jgi:gluconolactonase
MKNLTFLIITIVFFACNNPHSVYTDAVFTDGIEGPYLDEENRLYVVNMYKNGTIGMVHNNNYKVIYSLPDSGIGNSIQFWNDTTFIVADYVQHIIWKLNTKNYTWEKWIVNDSMNQPNDLTVHPKGWGYASDPNWVKQTGNIWRFNSNGTMDLLLKNQGTTNGICTSLDGKYLWFNESVQRNIWRYEIDKNGDIFNGKIIHTFPNAGLDGMKSLPNGNVLIARYDAGEVVELTSNGKIVKKYTLKGQKPTNITIDKNFEFMYVTLQDTKWVEKLKL